MNIPSKLRLFGSRSNGSLSIMMGFVFLVLVSAVGGAIDLSNAMRQRMIAQHDLDAALLSTFRTEEAETMTAAQREKLVRMFMNATYEGFPADAAITVSQEADSYTATLDFESENTILSLVGMGTFDVGVRSNVTFAPPPPLELALVLDTTSSMAHGDKLETMKGAARDLVTTLTAFDTVRVALVPFSQHVNVGLANRDTSGLDIPEDVPDEEVCTSTPDMALSNCRSVESTCSNESCSNVTDTCTNDGVSQPCSRQQCSPGPSFQCQKQECDETPTGTHTTTCETIPGPKWRGCIGSRDYPGNSKDSMAGGNIPGFLEGSCAQPIMRLTTDGALVAGAIDAFTTNGETYIAPALLWGSRMISPITPFPDGTDDPKISKAIVLMSDGANTISKIAGELEHKGTNRADADALLLEVCDSIKDQGITIFTVAYDIGDAAGRRLLQDCASDGTGTFFDARTDDQLVDSFRSITRGFRSVRVSQ